MTRRTGNNYSGARRFFGQVPVSRWRRQGRLSGPANLFDGRYLVTPEEGRGWSVADMKYPKGDGNRIISENHRLMRDAKAWVEANKASLS